MPPSAEYDEALLQDVKLDKRAIQEGYSTDILREAEKAAQSQSRSNSTVPPEASGRSQPRRGDTNESSASREALAATPKALEAQAPPTKPRAFWKTTKGLIIIGAGVVIVIVAAVVGGVVGSRKKNNNETDTGDDTVGLPTSPTPTPEASQGTSGGTGGEQEGQAGQTGLPLPGATPTTSSLFSFPTLPTGTEGNVDTTAPGGDESGTVGTELNGLPQPNSGSGGSLSSVEIIGLE